MATRELEILLRVKDEATKAMNALSNSLKENEKKLEKNKEAWQTLAVASGTAFASLSAVMYKSIASASEAEKVQAQLGAVLKSTASKAGVFKDEAIALSNSLQKVTAYSDEAILSAENMLLTFTNISRDVFPLATETVLNMSTALGQDLKSSAIQLGKALQSPIDGVTALQRVGVRFTDTEKAMIETMVNAGDTMGAQKMILQELAKEFGGSATANANTFAGQIEQLKNKIDDLFEEIGTGLVPSLKSMSANILPAVDNIKKWVGENKQVVASLLMMGTAITGITTVIALLVLAGPKLLAIFTALKLAFASTAGVVGLLTAGLIVLATIIGQQLTEPMREHTAQLEKATDRINQLTDRYRELRKPIEADSAVIKEFSDAVKDANKNIKKAQDDLADLIQSHSDQIKSIKKSEADAIVEQEEKIAELQKSIAEKKLELQEDVSKDVSRRLREELSEMQDKLATEQGALASYSEYAKSIANEVTEARRFAGLTEFEQRMETFKLQEEMENIQFGKRKLQMENELKQLKLIKEEALKAETIYIDGVNKKEIERQNELKKVNQELINQIALINELNNMNGENKVDTGTFLKDLFKKLKSVTGFFPAFGISGVNDGVIQGGKIISTHPDDYIIATKNPASIGGGSGMNINITVNGDVSGQDLIDKVTDAIGLSIKRRIRV